MGVFGRSWYLTKLSFGVIQQDKELLLFPLLGGVFSLLYGAALLVPTVLVQLVNREGSVALGAVEMVAIFASYFGLAFIATFFNVCVVYTSKVRFEGGDATFGESLRFAFSRLGPIFLWSLLSATVGILLQTLENLAHEKNVAFRIVLTIVRSILGLIWTVVSMFVIPAMVYEGMGPLEALKSSVATVKQTWGESLVRHYGLGLIQFLFLLLGVGLSAALFAGLGSLGPAGVYTAIGLSAVYFIGVVLVFSVANGVYKTALYAYARSGQVPGGYDPSVLQSAFRTR